MKAILFITTLLLSTFSFANEYCADKSSEMDKIDGVLAKINPWGTWSGTWDGKSVVLKLSKSGGSFTGTATFDGSSYGPETVSICDYGNSYSIIIQSYEAQVEILGAKKIRITSPLNPSDKITLTKQ
jgi:hypothetical protein